MLGTIDDSTTKQRRAIESEIEHIQGYREEQLRNLLLFWLGLGFFLVISATAVPRTAPIGALIYIPLFTALGLSGYAYRLLKEEGNYERASLIFVASFVVGMGLLLLVSDGRDPLVRRYTPFMMPLIATMASLLLARTPALILTALGGLFIIIFWFRAPHTPGMDQVSDWMALILTALSAALAHVTAGNLYQTTSAVVKSYLQTRERRDEYYQKQKELDMALKERDWLNHELQMTNRALETSSQVGRQATSILKLEELLPRVVTLIQDSFEYYFVGIWTLDEKQARLRLSAGVTAMNKDTMMQDLYIPLDTPSIVVSVYESGNHRRVDDVFAITDYHVIDEFPHTRSVLALPLSVGQYTVGVLDIERKVIGGFKDTDRIVMQTLADQLAVAIRNAELYASEQYRRKVAESLESTGRELARSLDLREVPERILEQLDIVVPYGRGSIFIQDGDLLRYVAQRGFPAGYETTGTTIPIREGDVFQELRVSREPLIIDDTTSDDRFLQSEGLAVHCSWMGIPLTYKDRVTGMISLTRSEAGTFTPEDAHTVLAYAGQAAIALENASLVDEIRRFNDQLEQMVQERTEELQTAYQTLEKMDKNKSDFIRVAAHELRTPLTVIRGYGQMITNMAGEQSPMLPFLSGIISGTERLHAIVNSMLDVAMIDSQTLDIVKRKMYIWEVFERIEPAYEDALEERHLTLEINDLEAMPTLYADAQLLYKVFDQLISNAIKYTPDGRSVIVSSKLLEEEGEPFVQVTVQDQGIGIDLEYQELIFEKFYQTGEVAVHSSGRTKFKGGGPGLGLAVARGIIQAHGGHIWVESVGMDEETCPGSQFHVLLPVGQV